MKNQLTLIALLACGPALADPPTPPKPQPPEQRWEFIGSYVAPIDAGDPDAVVNAVIDPDSIKRHGSIVEVITGTLFHQENGKWVPGSTGPGAGVYFIRKYKIDCHYHTFNEVWWNTDRGIALGMPPQDMDDTWVTIGSNDQWEVAFIEKRVCRKTPN